MLFSPIAHRTFLILAAAFFVAAGFTSTCRCTKGAHPVAESERPIEPAFTGMILVATAEMPDPDFAGTRILMLEHDDGGAIGVILNRPVGSLGDAITVLDGGPLGTVRPFLLHESSYALASTRPLFGDVALTSGADVRLLSDAMNGEGPRHVFVVNGYAGWGPEQLEGELADGVWRLEERGDLWR